MALYTRKGDAGTTKLFDTAAGERITKSADIFEALGTLDECNALIGICKALARDAALTVGDDTVADILHGVQEHVFTIQAEVAGAKKTITHIGVAGLESVIARVEQELPEITTFFIPGASLLSSYFDLARTVIRRAERAVVRLSERASDERVHDVRVVSQDSFAYINRLSSLLYALARYVPHVQGIAEKSPTYSA